LWWTDDGNQEESHLAFWHERSALYIFVRSPIHRLKGRLLKEKKKENEKKTSFPFSFWIENVGVVWFF